MYLERNDIEKDVLRQGDIISKTQILGAINYNSIYFQIDQKGNHKS